MRTLLNNRVSRSIERGIGALTIAGFVLSIQACSLSDLVSTTLPSGATDPATLETPQGAVDRYKGAIFRFRTIYSGYNSGNAFISVSGLLSDELTSGQYNTLSSGDYTAVSLTDSRNLSGYELHGAASHLAAIWAGLSATRLTAQDAIDALKRFAPDAPSDMIGHAHALQGMSEVALAELYCSGVPLSKLKAGGGFEYGVALTTEKLLEHAVAQFDSAILVIHDSTHFLNFAKVGKARALVNLGRYAEAAQAVSGIPTDFKYQNYHSLLPAGAIGVSNFTNAPSTGNNGIMADIEGGNGLNYITANDPRVIANDTSLVFQSYPLTNVILPRKWMTPNSAAPVTIADGIEARLIEAEADLDAGNPAWLTKLNALRTSCTTGGPCAVPAPAGTGGVAGLSPLTDPGTTAGRVDLLFRERAFWLYLTGHRHGDMRRLVRQYGRSGGDIFPGGSYPAGPDGSYGNDVNLPAPASEIANNPGYNGCFNRDA